MGGNMAEKQSGNRGLALLAVNFAVLVLFLIAHMVDLGIVMSYILYYGWFLTGVATLFILVVVMFLKKFGGWKDITLLVYSITVTLLLIASIIAMTLVDAGMI
jgi:hypothetical protein